MSVSYFGIVEVIERKDGGLEAKARQFVEDCVFTKAARGLVVFARIGNDIKSPACGPSGRSISNLRALGIAHTLVDLNEMSNSDSPLYNAVKKYLCDKRGSKRQTVPQGFMKTDSKNSDGTFVAPFIGGGDELQLLALNNSAPGEAKLSDCPALFTSTSTSSTSSTSSSSFSSPSRERAV